MSAEGPPWGSPERRVEEALRAHERGWSLTPLRGKKPVLKGWTSRPKPSAEDVGRWARSGNVGLRTGKVSGVVVIDEDRSKGGSVEELVLPTTVTAITGSGGSHFLFRLSEGLTVRNSAGKLAPNVDVRGDGGQIVLAGGIHPDTGEPYRWAEGLSPDEIELADFPAHILDRLQSHKGRPWKKNGGAVESDGSPGRRRFRKRAEAALRKAVAELRATPEGERNDTLNRLAYTLGGYVGTGLIERGQVEEDLAKTATEAGLEMGEMQATLRSGLDAGEKEPFDLEDLALRARVGGSHRPLTDLGNAERLAERFGNELRFVHDWKKFLFWDGRRWSTDRTGCVIRWAKTTVRSIYGEAASASSGEKAEAIANWAKVSEKKDRIIAMVELVRSEPGIPILPETLDRDPYLLNCHNGTIDLRTGELREHRRDDLITKVVPCAYDPDATCPTWMGVLEQVLPGVEVRGYAQRAVGYSLTGDQGEQVLFFLHGTGANGKSTFLLGVQNTLGHDYAIQAAPELLLRKNQRSHPTEIADLFGVRFAATVEVGDRQAFDEVLIKQLTGGDRQKGRRMREDFWEFEPTHHIWIAANHRPIICGTDDAIWRRVSLIPFTVQIPKKERDRQLISKLREEREGILAWAVRGCLEWQRRGLDPPQAVVMASDGYRSDMDPVGPFLAQSVRRRVGGRVGASDLYGIYREWAEEHDREPASQTEFGRRAREGGYVKRKTGGVYVYVDMELMGCVPEPGDSRGQSGPTSDINALKSPREESNAEVGPDRPQPSPTPPGTRSVPATTPASGGDDGAPIPSRRPGKGDPARNAADAGDLPGGR